VTLIAVPTFILITGSHLQAQLPSGEFQPSDTAVVPTPRRGEITVGHGGRDLSFGFVVPGGYDAVHIRWSSASRPEVQEEYKMGLPLRSDCIRTYTIHHVIGGQSYMFKVQPVEKGGNGLFSADKCGSWISRGYTAPRLTTVPSPAAPLPLKAPQNINALRENASEISVSWTVDQLADWYVVERRIAKTAAGEVGTASPWAPACSPLKRGTGRFVVHCPAPSNGVTNSFRVIAYNSQVQAISAPAVEHTFRGARTPRIVQPGTTSLP
jgi:hypothetical protein